MMTYQEIETMQSRRAALWTQVACAEIHRDMAHHKKCMAEIAKIDKELANAFTD